MLKNTFLLLTCFCLGFFTKIFSENTKIPSLSNTLITDEKAFSIKKKSEHIPFYVQDRDNKLLGVIHKPICDTNNPSKFPVIIFCHGLKDSKYGRLGSFIRLAEKITASGFIVIRFDFQGCGDSEGCWSHNLISDFDKNFECILDYVLKLPFVEKDKVGIFGHSLGCHTAIIGAAKHPCIKTTVLWAPIANGCLWGYDFLERFNPNNNIYSMLTLPADAEATHFRHAFSAEFLAIEDAAALKHLPTHFSVLHIHGIDDYVTPFHHQSIFSYENMHSQRKIKYTSLKNTQHALSECSELSEIENSIINWFQEELK